MPGSEQTVAVIDYGSSNLRSVSKAVEHVAEGSQRVIVTNNAEEIANADRVIFPGQGAIGDCMKNLIEQGLDEVIKTAMASKPFFGICLGLQSLMDWSDEDGGINGLGIMPGKVVHFPEDPKDPETGDRLKIPHMGWNQVNPTQDHFMWQGIESGSRFYFVHSYYVEPDQKDVIAATTDYCLKFTSAIARDNVFAVQFHPEKSQHDGLKLLVNFLEWDGVS